MEEFKKMCSVCCREKPIVDFHKKANSENRRNDCKDCVSARYKRWKENCPESVRDKWRKASRKYSHKDGHYRKRTLKKYNLSIEEHNQLFDKQNGLCAICKSDRTLVIDHCHKTNKVRGLICNMCNVGLGNFKDNIDNLLIAIDYLKQHSNREE